MLVTARYYQKGVCRTFGSPCMLHEHSLGVACTPTWVLMVWNHIWFGTIWNACACVASAVQDVPFFQSILPCIKSGDQSHIAVVVSCWQSSRTHCLHSRTRLLQHSAYTLSSKLNGTGHSAAAMYVLFISLFCSSVYVWLDRMDSWAGCCVRLWVCAGSSTIAAAACSLSLSLTTLSAQLAYSVQAQHFPACIAGMTM